MTNIFLQNQRVQAELIEPEVESIDSSEELFQVIDYVRGKNFMALRKGDSRLCRKINGEVADWINTQTSSNASLWICSPYPNLKQEGLLMEHVIGIVSTEGKSFIFDGTAGQTTLCNQNILIQEIEIAQTQHEGLTAIMGGEGWKQLYY